ncbi:ABC transporter ATP-binding protein [Guggenheimella bovis]
MANFEEKELEKGIDLKLLKRLGKYTKPHLKILILCVVLLFITTIADLYRPRLVKDVIDQYITVEKVTLKEVDEGGFQAGDKHFVIDKEGTFTKDGDTITDGTKTYSLTDKKAFNDYRLQAIFRYAIILGILILLAFFATYGQSILLTIVGEKVVYSLRSDLFQKLQGLDLNFYENNPVGRLVTRMTNDMQNINALYTEVIVSFLMDVALVLGSMGMMISLDARLALISFAVLPIMFGVTIIFRKQVREAYRVVRVKLAKINSDLNENFMGMKTIQIFNQEKKFKKSFDESNEEYRKASMKELYIYAVFRPVLNLLYYASLLSVLFFGGKMAIEGKVAVGVIVAFTLYIKMLFNPIMELAEKFNILQSAMSSIERIFLLMDEKELVLDHENLPVESLEGNVDFKDVRFSYINGQEVLKGVSFSAKKGETIAFVGATGSGKSTIINLLSRLYDVDSGEILIDGKNIKSYKKEELRKHISPVLQDVFLFSGTIRDNIRLRNTEITDDEILKACKYVNADRLIDRFEDGLDHAVVEGGATFSQGERQLLSFARAIVHNPDILILDEATSNIDTETEELIQDAITKVIRNRTTFVVAHRLSTIQHADQIIVIHKGEIKEMGTHDQLLEKKGLYYDLYELQYKDEQK